MNNRNSAGDGIGICGCTFIVFLILKLCEVIDWSWWWVTSPPWLPAALFVAVCIVVFIVGICIGIVRYIVKAKREGRRGEK